MRSSVSCALAAGVALSILVPGCSLLGLDRLPQSTCDESGGDSFCASLETVMPTGDTCLRWQCSEVTRHCEIEPRDVDADGSPAAMCEPTGVAPDCDDADPMNTPTALEVCDGNDDDCDEAVDEGTVGAAALTSLRDLPSGTTDVVFGRAPEGDENVVAALTATGSVSVVTDAAVAGFLTAPVRTVGGPTPLAPTGLSAIEGLGMNRYAMLLELGGGCARLALGVLDTTTMSVRVPDAHAVAGFPSTGGGCPGGVLDTSTGSLGRDAASGDLLVAYLESNRRDCGGTVAAPVLVIGAPDAAPAADTVVPLELGESVDPRAPAIVSLGARAFLVAFPTADGGIAVHRVTLAIDGTATATLVHMEAPDASGLRGDVRLALGPTSGGTTTVGLTYAYGCGAAPVALRLLSVTSAAVTPGPRIPGTTATGARLPFAAYQPSLDEWLLGWRTRMALGGVRVDAASMLIGEGFDLTSDMGGFESSLFLVAPGRGTGAAYRLLTTRADAGTTRAVAAELGCLAPVGSP